MEHEIAKGLEVWVLQNLLNFSIMMGFVALGIALIEPYHRTIERLLTLRVSIEIWRVMTVVIVDILLAAVVLVGLFVINPDIMADIKMSVPFYPLAVVLIAGAFILRVFRGGSVPGRPAHLRALWLLFLANLTNLVGFTFVMEAPSSEYLKLHPSPVWLWIKTHLRSNSSPHGLELAQWTFWLFFPILVLLLLWAFGSAMAAIRNSQDATG